IISGVKDEEIQIGEVLDLKKGVKAIDDIEGDITSRMIISGEVNNQVPGVYQIVYTVSDKDGNIGKAVRKVTVLENDDN
ncbi:MAG: immunoglobulin-like domain-containing protein, partial [Longibaculum sp.]